MKNSCEKKIYELFRGRCAINPAHRARVIHHIIPRSVYKGDPDTEENLIPLCSECHAMIHREGTKLWRPELWKIRESIQ